MTYLQRLTTTIIQFNSKRLNHRDGVAWDNRKISAAKRYYPRGRVAQRLLQLERAKVWRELTRAIDLHSHGFTVPKDIL